MAYDIGLKLGVDGEAEFRKNLQNATSQIKTLTTEMGAVTAQFAKNATSQEALTAKTGVLNKQIEAQKNALASQQDYLGRAVELYGENSNQALSWQRAVNQSTATLHNLENALSDANEALEALNGDGLDGLSDGLEDVSDGASDAADALDNAGFNALNFGDILKANVVSDLIISGLKEVAGLIKDLAGESISAAAEVQAQNSQFEQTFGELGGTAQEAIDRVAESSGILSTRLQSTGTQLYAFARSAGGDTTQSMDLMERALSLAADSAAYYDRSLEDTAESLQSFLKGNYANDAALGLSATETTRNAAAMELFGAKFNDLTEIQKQETLLQMVADSMELSGAMGQAQREAAGWENVQGNLNEALRQAKADIGAGLLPAVTELSQALTGALTGDISAGEFGEAAGEIVATLITDFAAAAPGMVDAGVELLRSLLTGLVSGDNPEQIADSMGDIVVTLIEGGIEMLPDVVSFAARIITSIVGSIAFHLPELLSAGATAMMDLSLELLKSVPDFVVAGAQLLAGVEQGIVEYFRTVLNRVAEVATGLLNKFKEVLGIHSPSREFYTIGEYLMEGLAIGMEDSKGQVMETAEDIANEVTTRFKDLTSALDQRSSIADLQYQLWELTGGAEADEAAQYERQLTKLTEQEVLQGGAVEAAQAAYEEMADQYGENSSEALDYLEILLEEQIAYEKLAQSIQEVLDKQAELAGSSVTDSYADLADTMVSGSGGTTSRVSGSGGAGEGSTQYVGTTVLTIDGREFARATQTYYREEDAANPEVVSDPL